MVDPIKHVEWGCAAPYDATDDTPYTGGDPARMGALGVLDDLCDRGGIKREFGKIDDDVRTEIVNSLTAIIQAAFDQDEEAAPAEDPWDPTPEQRAEWEAAALKEKLEQEAWKVAQLAVVLRGRGMALDVMTDDLWSGIAVTNARKILAEARRQVTAEPKSAMTGAD